MAAIRLAGVIRESIVDGPGFRFVVFTQGCPIIAPAARTPAPMILREDMMGIPTGCLRNSAKTLCWPA